MNDSSGVQAVVFLASASGDYASGTNWAPSNGGLSRWFVGDVDGDGTSDLIALNQHGDFVNFNVYLSTGSKFIYQSWSSTRRGSDYLNRPWAVGDINGDGRADLISAGVGGGITQADALESTGTTFTVRVWGSWSTTITSQSGLAGDFNSLPRRRPGATAEPTCRCCRRQTASGGRTTCWPRAETTPTCWPA